MNNKQLKNLKDRLWEGADQLRANSGLKSTEYATPILGLIFLRFAESKYSKYEAEIIRLYQKTKGPAPNVPYMSSPSKNADSICHRRLGSIIFSPCRNLKTSRRKRNWQWRQ